MSRGWIVTPQTSVWWDLKYEGYRISNLLRCHIFTRLDPKTIFTGHFPIIKFWTSNNHESMNNSLFIENVNCKLLIRQLKTDVNYYKRLSAKLSHRFHQLSQVLCTTVWCAPMGNGQVCQNIETLGNWFFAIIDHLILIARVTWLIRIEHCTL